MAIQRFRITGLTHAAEADVERLLRGVAGVLFASASHEDACVEVEFEDDAVTTDEIRGVLAGLGYDARIVA